MSSFNTHHRRVYDEGLPARVRHTNLRSCLVHFAPYGFRATYHHLCLSAGIPKNPEKDPNSLIRAVAELHHARQLWLADERGAYANSRRTKHVAFGRRKQTSHGEAGSVGGGTLPTAPSRRSIPASRCRWSSSGYSVRRSRSMKLLP